MGGWVGVGFSVGRASCGHGVGRLAMELSRIILVAMER